MKTIDFEFYILKLIKAFLLIKPVDYKMYSNLQLNTKNIFTTKI